MGHDYLLAVVLGIVEGLTEFLPVSSTAHLRFSEALLHVSLQDGYWKMFSIVIQIGAVLCLPFYFRQRLLAFAATFPRGERGDRTLFTHPLGLTTIAFVTTAAPSYFLTKIIGAHLESLVVMGWSLIVGGLIMWAVDARNARAEAAGPGVPGRIHTWNVDAMSIGQAVWIGACQILSGVFPGTSRSMSTIAAGQAAGMSRAAALEFSFLVSIPVMAVATGYAFLKSFAGGANPLGASGLDAHGLGVLAIGLVVSFIVAYASVAWLMAFVRRHGFTAFAIYRLAAGALVLGFLTRLGR